MSALLVLPYDPSLHRTLDEPRVQLDRLEAVDYPTIIGKLRALLESHDLKDTVGLALIHRHFEQSDCERLVEVFENGKSLTSPCEVLENRIVPHTWTFRTNNGVVQLYPVEFLAVEHANESFFAASTALLANQQFLLEFNEILSSAGLSEVLGVTVHHRDSIRDPNSPQLHERSSGRTRTSILAPSIGEGIGAIPTTWDFRFCRPDACGDRWQCTDSCCGQGTDAESE